MSDRYKKLIEALRGLHPLPQQTLFNAEVVKVDGESCTVRFGDLELEDVRLKATINGESNKTLLFPKVGSLVLVGSLTGDLKDLAVLKIDDLERLEYRHGNMLLEVDGKGGKVQLSNGKYSLLDLVGDLVEIIKGLKVTTPSGPSTALTPDSIAAIAQFETKFKQLIK